MDTKILGQSSTLLRIEIENGNHEVLHMLVQEILKDKGVEFAAYKKNHNLFNKFTLQIRTKKKNPKTVVNTAITKITKDLKKANKTILTVLK